MEKRDHSYVEEEILRYFVSHPHAADTVDGITTWWLKRNGIHIEHNAVDVALKRLVGLKRIRVHKSADGHVLYCNKEKK